MYLIDQHIEIRLPQLVALLAVLILYQPSVHVDRVIATREQRDKVLGDGWLPRGLEGDEQLLAHVLTRAGSGD